MDCIWEHFFKWGKLVSHLAFCNLRIAGGHKVGALRLWPKAKSLVDLIDWESLKWRPLVSYAGHHWKMMQSLASRWALFQVTYHQVGFHVSSPKEVLKKIDKFNRMLDDWIGGDPGGLTKEMRDIGEFFTNIPRDRMMRVIKKYQEKTARRDPDAVFF